MSSSPLFALVASVLFMASYRYRNYWPYLLIAFIALALLVELYSNRHFYHVFARFAFSTRTVYYRIDLIEEALTGGMTGHWLFGYGYIGVAASNDNTGFHWVHKDMVNIYIAHLARTGLVGLVPFMFLNVAYYARLRLAMVRSYDMADRWLIWCFAAGLVGWNVAMMTVNLLSQIQPLFYLVIAIACNAPLLFKPDRKVKPAPLWRPWAQARNAT